MEKDVSSGFKEIAAVVALDNRLIDGDTILHELSMSDLVRFRLAVNGLMMVADEEWQLRLEEHSQEEVHIPYEDDDDEWQ